MTYLLNASGRRVKVITKASAPHSFTEISAKSEHITLVLAISAAGGYMRPLCIFPLQTLPPLDPRAETFFCISGQQNGFISNDIFFNWVCAVFIPHIIQIRKNLNRPNAKALLFIDPHSTRAYPPAIEEFEKNNIMVKVLLAHSSTISQPLDLTVNHELKRTLSIYFQPKASEALPDK